MVKSEKIIKTKKTSKTNKIIILILKNIYLKITLETNIYIKNKILYNIMV